jgi:hypothetical protein
MSLYGTEWMERGYGLLTRVSSKQTNKISLRTETNRNKICFGCVSVCFVKPKTKYFGLFRFVSVFRTYIETTETNKTVSKQTETNPKFSEKYHNMFRLVFCLFGFNRNIETLCFGIETKQPKQTFMFRIVPKLVSVVSNRN